MTLAPNGAANFKAYKWTFTNATTRGALASPQAAGDVGSIAFQEDDASLWVLSDHDPVTWVALGGSGGVTLPTSATIFANQFVATVGTGFVTVGSRGDSAFGLECNGDGHADQDEFTATFLLAPGTYDVKFVGIKASNRGILDWALDGANIALNQDWYDASDVPNHQFTVTDVVVGAGTGGRHTLRFKIDGQNGSSGGFQFALGAIWFIPS